jgi:hypothetical protein
MAEFTNEQIEGFINAAVLDRIREQVALRLSTPIVYSQEWYESRDQLAMFEAAFAKCGTKYNNRYKMCHALLVAYNAFLESYEDDYDKLLPSP